MERRNHARVAVNLKAALLDDQAMPVGCRVRDVSKGGMLLQHEHYDKATTFHEGDTVEVRLSIRQADERKLIPLTMTVRRVEENGIGVEFLEPQSQLMTLVEPYRLDKEETQEMAANQARVRNAAASSVSPLSASTSARASRRRHAIQRARAQFAETMKTADRPVAEKEQTAAEQPAGKNFFTGKDDRRLFYIGLASLIIAVGILLLDIGVRTHLENRMSALESVVDRQANALTILRTRLTPAATRTTEISELNARVDTLTTSFAALETRIMQDAGQATASTATATATASTADTLSSDPQTTTNKTAAEAPAKQTAQTQAQNFGDEGPWVINLLSLYDQAAADRFMGKAHAQGIRADTRQVSVNGQQVWRIQVGGFSTRDEASAYSNESKAKLGLNNVWIFKKRQ
jgi:cell division septation protein DedD